MALWGKTERLDSISYMCGFCGNKVASREGWYALSEEVQFCEDTNYDINDYLVGSIRICPHCSKPTYFGKHMAQYPPAQVQADIKHVPEIIETVYHEASTCISNRCYTAAVMLCRKLLMNIAVAEGAEKDKTFNYYVECLQKAGLVGGRAAQALQKIRKLGNEANHDVKPRYQKEAELALHFLEAVLRTSYELPKELGIEDSQDTTTADPG